jgi:hypothetical protein
MYSTQTSIICNKSRLYNLRFLKDMKKDYYMAYPSHSLYLEIKDLVRSITALEQTLKKYM